MKTLFAKLPVMSKKVTPDESLKKSITKDEKKEQLEKQISALTVKIRKEKQLNKQIN